MSQEMFRWANAALAFLLVWLWLTWAISHLRVLASRLIGFSVLPVWCVISAGSYNAATRHLQFNSWAIAMTFALILVDGALAFVLATRR